MKIFYFFNFNSFIDNYLNNCANNVIVSFIFILFTPSVALSNLDACNIIRSSSNSDRQSLAKLQALLEQKIDLTKLNCDTPHRSLLNVAYKSPGTSYFVSDIRQGRYDNIVQLLNRGADVREASYDGSTPLHVVARTGDINLIYLYVEAGADINAQDYNNNSKTPLEEAILANAETVNLLLHLGADPEIGDPLADAIYFKKAKILKILLQHGATPSEELLAETYQDFGDNSKDYEERQIIAVLDEYQNAIKGEGNSNFFNPPPPHPLQLLPSLEDPPIVEATRNNNLIEVRKLIAQGVDVDLVSKHEPFGNDVYSATSLHIAIAKGYNDIAKALIEAGADISLQNGEGRHPLYLAANNLEITKLLLEKKASVDLKTAAFQQTALMASDNVEVINLLLENGANINHQSEYGYTALYNAIERKSTATVDLLVQRGADVNLKSFSVLNQTPIEEAVEEDLIEIVEILQAANAQIDDKPKILRFAIENQNLELVKKLVTEQGLDEYLKTEPGSKILVDYIHGFYALKDLNIVKFLIEQGADVNAVSETNNYRVLHAVTDIQVADYLIQQGAEVNVVDDKGQTPLHNYYSPNNTTSTKLARLLIQNGANIHAKDNSGQTPLHIATDRGDIATIKLFLNNGADINAIDNQGETPLHIAARNGNLATVKYLLQNNANPQIIANSSHTTLLHAAVLGGQWKIAFLTRNGGSLYASDFVLNPSWNQHVVPYFEIIELLLKVGVNRTIVNSEGLTPVEAIANCLSSRNQDLVEYARQAIAIIEPNRNLDEINSKNGNCPIFHG